MKTWKISLTGLVIISAVLSLAFRRIEMHPKRNMPFVPPDGCVFRTIMGEESSDSAFIYKTPQKVKVSVDQGLAWLAGAQNGNGGWGAGSHDRQNIRDPHAVPADPATTSMVGMAILRSGTTLTHGAYTSQLRRALNYILESAEQSPHDAPNITPLSGTQIQTKLGANIDVILAAQFLSNVMDHIGDDDPLKSRVKASLNKCVDKIQKAQDADGSIAGAGWAGVLQSSFASTALEAAQVRGAQVDHEALERSRAFQKNNYDTKTGKVNTDMGAGIVLYSVTGSARASAKEARRVKEDVQRAKAEGRLAQDAAPTPDNLEKIGYARDEAIKQSTAYEVYESAKVQAQREDVMSGFGNNGGEEFLSYLQTGEGMIINKDNSWKSWYDNMSGRLVSIQNNDGSWSGHHCITSPVFCTATCLLILAVNNDVDQLVKQGG